MGLKDGICGVCGSQCHSFTLFGDVEICDECFEHLITIMQYKNIDDITPDDKKKLMKFCNLMVKTLKFKDEEK